MKTLELLAPAKDLRTARAAIDSGADAVYMGGPALGARAAATNSLDDIREAARYAHLFGAKLYLTMNTIVYEHELEEARRIAEAALEAGVDALIVQDLAYTRMGLRGAELHASTQMYNASPEKVAFLGRAGFSRIVLERGLTGEQMREICKATDAEIEVFIHGAICVSGSGRCYMSRSLSHRSGNRGECSQPCRQTYDLADGSGKLIRKGLHLLSVKDLDLTAHIDELIDMGVVSFKIEGRLKDEAYVRNITAHYNNLLNQAIAKRSGEYQRASYGSVKLDFTPSPAKTFTRNGGDYIFGGKRPSLASFDTPKAMGELLGRVAQIRGRGFTFERCKATLRAGDGICFIAGGVLGGTNINSVENGIVRPNRMEGIEVGTLIHRNFDKAFADTLAQTRTRRTLPVRLQLSGSTESICLRGWSNNNEVELSLQGPFEQATKPEMALTSLRSSLVKSGGSVFEVEQVDVEFEEAVPFVATGTINALRRQLLDTLQRQLEEAKPQRNVATKEVGLPYPQRTIGGDHNVVNSLARRFYADHGVERIDEGYDLLPDLEGIEVMRTPYCLRREIGHCLRSGSRLKEPLTLIHGENRFRLRFDCKECMMYVIKS